jgi:hypothetical protein
VTVVVPADAGTGPLAVVTAAGTSPPSTTVLKVVPKLTGFLPGSGSVGSSVVLSGTGLTNVTAVRFGTKAAAFTADSAAQITATVPAGAVTGKITVVTAGGTAVTATSFTVTP